MAHSSTIIILGASTRSAATSARRAGWSPWCADLYADADLRLIADVCQVNLKQYPRGLLDALANAHRAPVMYTGALENRPDLIARIDREIWGNSPDVLRAIRSPKRWTECLRDHGIPCPALANDPKTTGPWLLKPRRSAGGIGIQHFDGQAFSPRTHFLQERIDGMPISAVFLGQDDDAILVGVTRQLVGISWLHATGFYYAGSVGPLSLQDDIMRRWRDLGSTLAKHFALRGLFGVDAILRDDVPWPIEINPRYTASMEVLERGYKIALLTGHCEAFEAVSKKRNTLFPRQLVSAKRIQAVWAKGVLYARDALVFPLHGPWDASLEPGADLDTTEYADIPNPGEIIEQGRPILTLFASAASVEESLAKLQEKAAGLDRCLWG